MFLLCPEALAASAFCVEDSLEARGFRVTVELGRRARRWVRRAPPGSPSLRILCVSTIDPAFAAQLRQGRPDFHIVALTTPRAMVTEIERIVGRSRSDRRPRPSRMILAQPTLMEQSLHQDRRWGLGMAMGAVGLLVVGGLLGASLGTAEPAAAEPTVARPVVRAPFEETVAPRRKKDREPVLSAVAPIDPERLLDDEALTERPVPRGR